MYWDVLKVKTEKDLTLSVQFSDGVSGKVRFMPSHLTGVFTALKEPKLFNQAHVEDGVVTWPGEIDLAPDAMYKAIKQHGEWILK